MKPFHARLKAALQTARDDVARTREIGRRRSCKDTADPFMVARLRLFTALEVLARHNAAATSDDYLLGLICAAKEARVLWHESHQPRRRNHG